MKEHGSIALFQYWNRLRAGRAAPLKTEIEPGEIKTLLADTFILEQDGYGETVFRLAGSRLCSIWGRELKGLPFAALWKEKDRRLLGRLVRGVFDARSAVVMDYVGTSRNGRECSFELLLLPLEGNGGTAPRCLGSIASVGRPYWLGTDPIVSTRIDSLGVIDPDKQSPFGQRRHTADAPTLVPRCSGMIAQENARRVRHLLVLEGGRQA